MPRPFLNPHEALQTQQNREWYQDQLGLEVRRRDPEWIWRCDFVFDHPGMAFSEEFRQLNPDVDIRVFEHPRMTPERHRRETTRWHNLLAENGLEARALPGAGPVGEDGVPVVGLELAPRRPRFAAPRDPDREPRPHNREYLTRYPQLDLTKAPQGIFIPRDVKLPPFKVDYDSHEQINTKLVSTCILIKDMPYTVLRVAEKADGTFALVLQDTHNKVTWVNYSEVQDCRGIAPGYVNREGSAYWVYRIPERQNSQGMCHRNTSYRRAGETRSNGAHPEWLVAALSQRKDVRYVPTLLELFENGALQSLRLSNNIALYASKKKGAAVAVEYRGRPLGLVVRDDQVKVFDENDLTPSWILKDVMNVGLRMGA